MVADPQRVQTVFLAAAKAGSPEARAAVLDNECGSDADLRQRVIIMLRSHDEQRGLQGGPALALDEPHEAHLHEGHVLSPADLEATVDTVPGVLPNRIVARRYKLLELIGEGGMGAVWKAEQRQPMKRLVALKLIKPEMISKSALARFESERQALALMDHPNIAKVYDGGTTEDQCPFFVMELVSGIPLTEYCDQRRLTIHARLELFIQVCQAVQHAHQKGIIHRDMKPTNILVTEHDGQPVPKVIDFGLAKPLQGIHALTDRTLYTVFGALVGTPLYMAPEQLGVNALDVDTRADVYSLGVILYELLTGSTPIERQRINENPWYEVCRLIRDIEAPRPSVRLSASGALASIAASRHTEPERLGKLLRGDLDWIVLKALEKDRSRRYETANGLAMDIQRYLANEPIVARPPTNFYRLQKLVHRNKLAFAAAAAVVAALVIGLGLSTWLFFQERAARQRAVTAEAQEITLRQKAEADQQRARIEAAKSQEIAIFMKDMLKGVGPKVALGRDTTMLREILEQTVQRLNNLHAQPAVEADLRVTLGSVYSDLGDYANAEAMHRAALALRTELLGPQHADVAHSLNDLAQVLYQQSKWADSEAMHGQALRIRRQIFGDEHLEVAESLNNIAEAIRRQRQRYDEAEAMHRQALDTRNRLLGIEHPDIALSMNNLGLLLWIRGTRGADTYAEAEAMHRGALAMRRKLLGAEHPDVATSLDRLGLVLHWRGRYAEAEEVHREALAMRRKLLGNEHPDVAHSLLNLANSLRYQEKFAEVQPMLLEALAIRKQQLGSKHADVASTLNMLAWNLATCSDQSLRDPRQAVEFARQAVDIDPPEPIFRSTLGVAHYRAGEWEAAQRELLKAIEMRKFDATDFFYLAMTYWQLGERQKARESYDKAAAWTEVHGATGVLKRAHAEAADLLGMPLNY